VWKTGAITGLRARGGFEVDEEWSEGKLRLASVRSTIGGTLRIRSYVELEGEGLQPAEGDCPNPLFASAQIKEPLLAKSLTTKPKLTVKKVYEYDLQTVAGSEYHLYRLGTMTGIDATLNDKGKMINDHHFYDLQGRVVTQPQKGVYIRNGKKVVNSK
jgi:alpha-L-fucosidase 2